MDAIKVTNMNFASGVEATAHFLKRGFTTVEEASRHPDLRVMDDGINVVQIRRVAMLEWVATVVEVA